MTTSHFFSELHTKISHLLQHAPGKEQVEQSIKAILHAGFTKMDLVTREEFDIQSQVLAATRKKLQLLEKRVTELESLLEKASAPPTCH